jgi:hypothetical protein
MTKNSIDPSISDRLTMVFRKTWPRSLSQRSFSTSRRQYY